MKRSTVIGIFAVGVVAVACIVIVLIFVYNNNRVKPAVQAAYAEKSTPLPDDLTVIPISFTLPAEKVALVRYDVYGPALLETDKFGLQQPGGSTDFVALPLSCPDRRDCGMKKVEIAALKARDGVRVINWRQRGGFQPEGAGVYTIRVPAAIEDGNYGFSINVLAPDGHQAAVHVYFHEGDRQTAIDLGTLTPNRLH